MNELMQTNTKIHVKGIREGLLIAVGDKDWETVVDDLFSMIDSKAEFFQGAKIIIDVGYHVLHAAELGAFRDRLSDRGIILTTILSFSPTTESTAQLLGLATKVSGSKPEKVIRTIDQQADGDPGLFIRRTLRSGFHIKYDGQVFVFGDVNPGAEIISTGSIFVWGKLKGAAHAGSEGDESTMICALEMEPNSLSIGGIFLSNINRKKKSIAQCAKVKEHQIQIENWDQKSR